MIAGICVHFDIYQISQKTQKNVKSHQLLSVILGKFDASEKSYKIQKNVMLTVI